MTKKDKNGTEYKFLNTPRPLKPILNGNYGPILTYEVEALLDGEKITLVYENIGNGQINKLRIV